MKIGIMGGTFDPIHNGHLIMAEYAKSHLKLDKIIFIPSGVHPFKDNKHITDSKKRIEMITLSIESNKDFQISTIEIDRKGITYTIDTIKELKKEYIEDEIYFIIGTDIVFEIEKWKDFEKLKELCKFVLFYRIGKNKSEEKIEELETKYEIRFEKVQAPIIEISSTEIRKRIKNNLSIKYLVNEEVEEYILKYNLYKE